jgi:hypothetical protein
MIQDEPELWIIVSNSLDLRTFSTASANMRHLRPRPKQELLSRFARNVSQFHGVLLQEYGRQTQFAFKRSI